MGGNGEYVKHAGGNIGRPVPAGPGGGCVKTGPFAKYVTPNPQMLTGSILNFS
jgi:hypothetical protein